MSFFTSAEHACFRDANIDPRLAHGAREMILRAAESLAVTDGLVIGGSTLAAHGLRQTGDVDLLLPGKSWQRFQSNLDTISDWQITREVGIRGRADSRRLRGVHLRAVSVAGVMPGQPVSVYAADGFAGMRVTDEAMYANADMLGGMMYRGLWKLRRDKADLVRRKTTQPRSAHKLKQDAHDVTLIDSHLAFHDPLRTRLTKASRCVLRSVW